MIKRSVPSTALLLNCLLYTSIPTLDPFSSSIRRNRSPRVSDTVGGDERLPLLPSRLDCSSFLFFFLLPVFSMTRQEIVDKSAIKNAISNVFLYNTHLLHFSSFFFFFFSCSTYCICCALRFLMFIFQKYKNPRLFGPGD